MESLLLVHTDSDDRDMYAEYLRGRGIDVLEVGTTNEALPLVSNVDVVVTGLMVPGSLPPLDLIQRIRTERPGTPIIVVTAYALSAQIERAECVGADSVLLKPCLPDQLLSEVRAVIERHRVSLVPKGDRRSGDERRSVGRGRRDADQL